MYKFLEKKLEQKYKNSLILIDKKAGITSHDEVYNLRRILKTKKVGHSGTLDPKVTGLLVIGVGKGLKILEYMLLSEKVYTAEFLFHQKISQEKFEKIRQEFLGKIQQLPPVKSAVKREVREREIYDLKILDFDKNERWVKLRTAVERGTYIRKLAHDMGEKIGVIVSMGDLRRNKVGVFTDKDNFINSALLKEKFQKFYKTKCLIKKIFYYFNLKKYFYSLEDFFEREKKFQKIFINKNSLQYVLAGNSVRWKNLQSPQNIFKDKMISIWYKNKVIGIGEIIKENFENKSDEMKIIKIKKLLV